MDFPKITVYITSHNYEAYIECAIQSVLKQTTQDFELLIIDDGSTDNTRNLLKKYEDHPKISIILQENQGLPRTCNTALEHAKGEYLIRLDADDYLDENALGVMASFLDAHPDVDLVYPDYYEIDSHGEIIGLVRRKKIGEDAKLLDLPAHGACTMMRTSCLRELGGYSQDIPCQDGYDLWVRFIQKYTPRNVNLPLFYYRKHTDSITAQSKKVLAARKYIKEKHANVNHLKRCIILPIREEHAGIGDQLPLLEINDKPLMSYAIEHAKQSGADKVLVVTESDAIASCAQRCGVETIKRPAKLAKQGTRVEGTIVYAIEQLKESGYVPDLVCVYFYTSPLITGEHVKEAFNTLTLFDADSVISVMENPRIHYRHGTHGLEPITQRKLKHERDFLYEESGGIIVSRTDAITPDSLLGKKISHIVLSPDEAIDIEDKFSLWTVTQILTKHEEFKQLENIRITRGY